MRYSRRSRLVTALVALICVLFSQLAVAAYLCPSMQISHAVEAAAMAAMEAEHQQMSGCHAQDASELQPGCHDRGMTVTQSLDKPELPNISPFVASLLVQTLSAAGPLPQTDDVPPANLLLTRSTAPPLAIRNCCFRI